MTDEEIRHAIRYLDSDQQSITGDVTRVIAIAIVCDVWRCLILRFGRGWRWRWNFTDDTEDETRAPAFL